MDVYNYFNLGNQLLSQGDIEGALSAYHNALYISPHFFESFLCRGIGFLEKEYYDAAIFDFKTYLSHFPSNALARSLLEKTIVLRNKRNQQLRNKKTVHGFVVRKHLGAGWEGAVYVVDGLNNNKFIIKVFHENYVNEINQNGYIRILRQPVRSCRSDLIRLANVLTHDAEIIDTLYPIRLLINNNKIEGLLYKYEWLLKISLRRFLSSELILGILGAFFRTQAYLLRKAKLCLADASVGQFLLTTGGNFRFVDYGISIIPLNDFRCRNDHWETVTLVKLFYELLNPSKKHLFGHGNWEIIFDKHNGLVPYVEKYHVLREVLDLIHRQEWKTFLDHNFYEHFQDIFPKSLNLMSIFGVYYNNFITRIMKGFFKRSGQPTNFCQTII